ncbi:hypothetical protein NDU88_002323 [Pleurodeles waltl]|uniref:Uncharacterized protein n=1 Tax=Pleurodeles waltl TaxID=8319 RepID=A0AAV7Q8E5_PLEWA|nr:hypothetical protein NDU88_002323 [Pleurodeles waltl]
MGASKISLSLRLNLDPSEDKLELSRLPGAGARCRRWRAEPSAAEERVMSSRGAEAHGACVKPQLCLKLT